MATGSQQFFPPSIHPVTSGADVLGCISTAHSCARLHRAAAIIAMMAAVVASGNLPIFYCLRCNDYLVVLYVLYEDVHAGDGLVGASYQSAPSEGYTGLLSSSSSSLEISQVPPFFLNRLTSDDHPSLR